METPVLPGLQDLPVPKVLLELSAQLAQLARTAPQERLAIVALPAQLARTESKAPPGQRVPLALPGLAPLGLLESVALREVLPGLSVLLARPDLEAAQPVPLVLPGQLAQTVLSEPPAQPG